MALPQIGTIYPLATDSILGQSSLGPLYTQPGGPGTQVFPQQSLGEKSAPYSFGCGHFFNLPAIWEQYDPATKQQAAIIACPICGYVQRIIEPYSEFLNYIQTPLVIA